MAEPKIDIHGDIFQALLALATIVRERPKVDPFTVLDEAEFVIQEVLAGRMDFDTVTPGDDPRTPTTSKQESEGGEDMQDQMQPPMTQREIEHVRKVAQSITAIEHPATFPDSARALFDDLVTLPYDEDEKWRVQVEMADGTRAVVSVNNRMRGEQARVQIRAIALELLGHFLKAREGQAVRELSIVPTSLDNGDCQ